jgi:hypothetical protein
LLSPLHRTTTDLYRACLTANLDSAFFTLGAFVEGLRQAREPGAAVLVSSVVARIGVANHEAIATAKAGVEGFGAFGGGDLRAVAHPHQHGRAGHHGYAGGGADHRQ